MLNGYAPEYVEKAYLTSIGKELDEGGKKDSKKGNDFLKDCTKDWCK